MLHLLRTHWFLLTLVGLIAVGMLAGMHGPAPFVDMLMRLVDPSWTTFLVLFLMAFSLDSGKLWESSVRRPAPFLWASLVNSVALPLLAWSLVPLQNSPDFSIGLMISASVPCTLASASVWTRRAGGNDAVTLLATLLTSGLCFLVTPFWLELTTGSGVRLDAVALALSLLGSALAPTVAGQAARLIPGAAFFATRRAFAISAIAQTFILLLVLVAACKAGQRLAATEQAPDVGGVLIVGVSCFLVHAIGMGIGVLGARWMQFRREDIVAVAFAGSQKTLPIGMLIATGASAFGNPDVLGPGIGVPFAVFPMLMFHAIQLFFDTAVAQRMAKQMQNAERRRQNAERRT